MQQCCYSQRADRYRLRLWAGDTRPVLSLRAGGGAFSPLACDCAREKGAARGVPSTGGVGTGRARKAALGASDLPVEPTVSRQCLMCCTPTSSLPANSIVSRRCLAESLPLISIGLPPSSSLASLAATPLNGPAAAEMSASSPPPPPPYTCFSRCVRAPGADTSTIAFTCSRCITAPGARSARGGGGSGGDASEPAAAAGDTLDTPARRLERCARICVI
mmetsp:Transcript_8670/g.22088  ORF Transcript_8670/g.22088 Transcript_8670/m.22088 type:complete len:219 (+) Transcript_8670:138-794(+)